MNLIVLWVLFVLIPCCYCSEEKVIPIKLQRDLTDIYKASCNITSNNVSIIKGKSTMFKATSGYNVTFGMCSLYNNNVQSIVNLTLKDVQLNPNGNNFSYEFNATMSGNWTCNFYSPRTWQNAVSIQLIDGVNYTKFTCDGIIITVNELLLCNTTCIIAVAVVATFLIIIIVILVFIVIYYKHKARPIHSLEKLSSMRQTTNDRVRYSKPPFKQALITDEPAERDSVIYDTLEHLQLQAPPEPPALDTIPRKPKKNKKNKYKDTPSSSSSDVNVVTDEKKKNNDKPRDKKKMSLPVMGASKDESEVKKRAFSFGKPKNKRKQATESVDKRTTIERIRDRPPLPLPITTDSEDEYEDMSAVTPTKPEPVRTMVKNPPKNKQPIAPKVENTLTKAVPPVQKKPVKSETITPKPIIPAVKPKTVSELENVLKKKGLGSNGPSVFPRPPGPRPIPSLPVPSSSEVTSTAIPRPKGALPKPLLASRPGPSKPTPPATFVKPTPPTPTKPFGQFQLSPPAVTPKPMPPAPLDAPVPPPISTLPRHGPPKSVEEQEEIYDTQWDDDWTYEPLQEYNIYSM